MPDSKVSSLTSASVAASNDAVYLVRDPQGAPLSRRVTLDTLLNSSLVYTGASITTSQLVVKDGPASINNQLSVGKVLSSSRNAVELAPWGTEGSATGELRLLEGTGGSNYVALKSPSAVLNDYVIRLPDHVGTSGQLLATYGNGACGLNTYWATVNPGAAGTIGTDTPADIGSSGTAGGASISGAQNHVHRGVLSFGASGTNVPMYGGVYATEGLNISLSQSNASVTFATLTCPTFGQLSVTGPASVTGDLNLGGSVDGVEIVGFNAAAFAVISLNPNMANERALTAGCGIQFEDSGVNGKLTVSYNPLHSQIFS